MELSLQNIEKLRHFPNCVDSLDRTDEMSLPRLHQSVHNRLSPLKMCTFRYVNMTKTKKLGTRQDTPGRFVCCIHIRYFIRVGNEALGGWGEGGSIGRIDWLMQSCKWLRVTLFNKTRRLSDTFAGSCAFTDTILTIIHNQKPIVYFVDPYCTCY